MPSVSVIIPTHNRATFLLCTLASVLRQTFADFEIIVVDDGSTDDTAARVRGLGDARIQLVQQEKQERAIARNTGIRHARGEFVAFLDDDDVWQPDFLAHTLRAFESHFGVVYCGWSFIDARDEPLPEAPHLPQARGAVLTDFFRGCFFPTSAALVRRACLENVGDFDPLLVPVEDWDMWLRLSLKRVEFDVVPEPLLLYRLHDQNSTNALERVESSARNLLSKTFAVLGASFADARTEAFARLDYSNAVKYFGAGQSERAAEFFARAVSAFPSLLDDVATFYQIICAMQPDGYKGTAERLDLAQGRDYVERALATCFAQDAALQSRRASAYANAYITLARLHFARREMSAARRFLRMAIQSNPHLATRVQTWSLGAKTIVPAPMLEQWKTRRQKDRAQSA